MAKTDRTMIADLDALFTPRHFIKLDGAEHDLVPLSVEGFVANSKMMQDLDEKAGMEGEAEIICQMLGRVFPTIGNERFRKMPLGTLKHLLDKATGLNGANSGDAETETVENPPMAAADASGG